MRTAARVRAVAIPVIMVLAGCGGQPISPVKLQINAPVLVKMQAKPALPVKVQVKFSAWTGGWLLLTNYGNKVLTNVRVTLARPDGKQMEFATGGMSPNEELSRHMVWGLDWVIYKNHTIRLSADGYSDVVVTGLGL